METDYLKILGYMPQQQTFEADFKDAEYQSHVEYELFGTDVTNSFDVKMDDITEENIVKVMRELYSQHEGAIIYVGFYEQSVDLENMDYDVDYPKADYFGSGMNKEITIGDKKIEFIP